MAHNAWTDEDIKILKENFSSCTDDELNLMLPNHSVASIATKRRKTGLTRDKHLYSYDDAVKEFEKTEYTLLSLKDEYINVNSKLRYLCPVHGEKSIALSKLMSGKGCNECGELKCRKTRMIEFNKEEDTKICESLNYTYVSTVRNKYGNINKLCINFICNKHNEYGVQTSIKSNLKKGSNGCVYCNRKNLSKSFIELELEKIVPHISVLSEYQKLTDRVECKCEKHNYYNTSTIQNLLLGKGCKYCGIEKMSESSKYKMSEIQDIIHKSCDTIDIIGEYNGITNINSFICKLCGYLWNGMIYKHMRCPSCGIKYIGENLIKDSLKDLEIEYVCQKSFVDCRDKLPLPFDFFLPDYNVCIEYNGEQHYKPISFFGGIEAFEIRKNHDNIKRDYCNNHNYKLIEIPYTVDTMDEIKNIIINNIA